MKTRLQNEILLIDVLTLLLIIIIIFLPSNVFRIIVGLPALVFFPGYILTIALFPRQDALGVIERVAISFGFSVCVTSLFGFVLNYTPWGITLYPILISLSIFIFAISLVAWLRRRRLVQAERFTLSFTLRLTPWRARTSIDKILSITLIAAILMTVGSLSYAIATPKTGEKFTEFYIVGTEGKAIDYLSELSVGEEGRVTVCITNREHETENYRVDVMMDNIRVYQVELLELKHDETVEEIVVLRPTKAGDNQKIEFLLYKNGEIEPYLKLHLWVDVGGVQN